MTIRFGRAVIAASSERWRREFAADIGVDYHRVVDWVVSGGHHLGLAALLALASPRQQAAGDEQKIDGDDGNEGFFGSGLP